MKRILVFSMLLFLSLLFFVGCDGIFNNLLVFTIPDDGGMDQYDSQFVSLIKSLNTPEKLASWLENNIEYEEDYIKSTPYEFYLRRKGDCDDYTHFNCYVLHYHGYEVNHLALFWEGGQILVDHVVTVFKNKNNQPYKYSILNNKSLISDGKIGGKQFNYNYISEVAESIAYLHDEELKEYKVYSWNFFFYRSVER